MTDLLEPPTVHDAPAGTRRLLRGLAPAALAAALILTGCAADPGELSDPAEPSDPAPAEDTPAEDAPDDAQPDAVARGTVTAGGTSYVITELRNCEPFEIEGIDVELELQGLGQSDTGEGVQIDVYIQDIGGAPFNDVSWSGPEGVFGGPDGADVQLADGRVSGSATLVDSLEQVELLDIQFDLEVPDDLIACR